VIINCAAYTAVDKAEQEDNLAFLINASAVGILARVASKYNALLIHISTDYVFDGKGYKPYMEEDPTNPVSLYAKSKHAGERQVQSYSNRALIIRTSWLYSEFGNNFVKTMMKYGKERGQLNVVFDQTGTPTYARDLAKAILDIITKKPAINGVEVFHYSNEGVTSWYDFALAIIEFSGITCKIIPIETKDYPLPAVRPFYSVFNKAKIKQRFNIEIPYWKDSLKVCIGRMA
jgi:dTDP-4-dehydrorhamnose reductase